MRAICGAIITAGALVGLGLTALGFGIRFHNQGVDAVNPHSGSPWGAAALMTSLIVLLIATLVGLAIAFIGLAYHHYQRYHEHLHRYGQTGTTTAPPRSTV